MKFPLRLRLSLENLDPLSIGLDRSVGNRVGTYRYIPGTVLRGALAAAWFTDHDPDDRADRAGFVELFEGSTVFGPAFPEGAKIEPLSVARCKYRRNTACWAFAAELARGSSPLLPECTSCLGQTELGKGRVLGVKEGEQTRTALENGTAKEGSLFTRAMLKPGTAFTGEIIAGNAIAAQWLERLTGTTIWIGGGLSTGGRVAVLSVTEAAETMPNGLDKDTSAVLRLDSPAILVDASTRPLTRFSDETLSDALGVPVKIEQQWVRVERAGGWNVVAGTPKPQETALAAGSTVRLVPTASVSGKRVATIQTSGIGLRRSEGFGRVTFQPLPWEPPAPDPADQPDTSEALQKLWKLADVGLVDQPYVADAIRTAASATGSVNLENIIGRDHWRHFDDGQRSTLAGLGTLDRQVLADLAVCLEEAQATAGSASGGTR